MVSSFSKNGDSLESSIHCFEILKDDRMMMRNNTMSSIIEGIGYIYGFK